MIDSIINYYLAEVDTFRKINSDFLWKIILWLFVSYYTVVQFLVLNVNKLYNYQWITGVFAVFCFGSYFFLLWHRDNLQNSILERIFFVRVRKSENVYKVSKIIEGCLMLKFLRYYHLDTDIKVTAIVEELKSRTKDKKELFIFRPEILQVILIPISIAVITIIISQNDNNFNNILVISITSALALLFFYFLWQKAKEIYEDIISFLFKRRLGISRLIETLENTILLMDTPTRMPTNIQDKQ